VAVCPEGRANPHQLLAGVRTARGLGQLRTALIQSAREAGCGEPLVGLQLTHSGRWSMPTAGRRRPRVAFRHPQLDGRVGADTASVLGDAEVGELIGAFARAARLAEAEGFAFVDVKHCHGYLLHEFLAARDRAGPWGGESLEERSRLAFEIVGAVRAAAPSLRIGVRLSVFDSVPRGPAGAPVDHAIPYRHAFGADGQDPARWDLSEPIRLVRRLVGEGVRWINVTASSPYYAPHLQRPAAFPPSDGYPPPEDPLVGVGRLFGAARAIRTAVPDAIVVASGSSYLQDYLPHVAQACLREGWFDAVGYGRMALSYPTLAADVLAGRALDRKRVCRTFSDCTTAPRHGIVSGCWPLDPFYRDRPERAAVEAAKRGGSAHA
jgi:2,4-dienoyl-CoA reductase-like NADH-dependent reductase (Old Yellow Enzyme family)